MHSFMRLSVLVASLTVCDAMLDILRANEMAVPTTASP